MLGGRLGRGTIVDADERDAVQPRAPVRDERDVALAGQAQQRMAIRQRPHDEPVDDRVGEQRRSFLLTGIERGDELEHGVLLRAAFGQASEELHDARVLEGVGELLAEQQADAPRAAAAQAARRRIGARIPEVAGRFEDPLTHRRAELVRPVVGVGHRHGRHAHGFGHGHERDVGLGFRSRHRFIALARCNDIPMEFHRDRLTWLAYALLAWFAYLQAAPGLVVAHLRDELDLSYSTGGLHVAAFAAGSLIAGVTASRLERALGRRALFWCAAALMGAGAVGLTAGRVAEATIGSLLVMGVGGGLLLVTIQAALADHHGERRAVALTEANVAASIAYVVLIGVLSLTAALHAGWRVALLASLVVLALVWWGNRRLAIDAPPLSQVVHGRLPAVFWISAAMLFCAASAEWCITAWGATFVGQAADVSTDTAVALMVGYFGGVLAGRTLGSRLARRHDPARLLALALAVTAAGFAILWPSTGPAQALVGLSLLGIGLGNLFPMGLSVTVALAPDRTVLASGRAVLMTSFAVLLAPLTVGTLADATSLTAALGVVPVMLVLAAAGLTLVRRAGKMCPVP